jgi:DNA processing protein
MDLQTSVAFSLLSGASRPYVAATLRRLSREFSGLEEAALVELVLAQASRTGDDLHQAMAEARRDAAAVLARARAGRITPIAWSDPRYPPALGSIVDPPPVLWTLGRLECLLGPAVAIVGSRAASSYALEVGFALGEQLGTRGVRVVSGLARGVDSAAHRGCLAAAGSTIAVFGSGPDVIYPPENADLAEQIAKSGLLVSELPPGTPPLAGHFPLRNRIISGISMAVVVVEASERSGSLITARCALEQGREVMAVPGNVLNGRNRGSHALLKDGAKVVESADDILGELGWTVSRAGEDSAKSMNTEPLLRIMEPGESYDLDDLGRLCGRPGASLLPRLLELELAGQVARAGGGRFVRTGQGMVR